MTDTEETYGDAAERILNRLGVRVTDEDMRYLVEELLDVQRATVEAAELEVRCE